MKQIRRSDPEPDFLFVEPSSLVVTQELRDVAAMALRDVAYEVGAFVTLVEGPMFDVWWEGRRPLLLGQIGGADLVAVSRADDLSAEELGRVLESLAPHTPAPLPLSTLEDRGVAQVLERILCPPT